jgi:hypothetical protein
VIRRANPGNLRFGTTPLRRAASGCSVLALVGLLVWRPRRDSRRELPSALPVDQPDHAALAAKDLSAEAVRPEPLEIGQLSARKRDRDRPLQPGESNGDALELSRRRA